MQAGLVEDASDKTLRNTEKKLLEKNVEHFFGPVHPDNNRYRKEPNDKPKREKLSGWQRRRGMPEEVWKFGYFDTEWFCGFVRRLWFRPGYYAGDEGPTKTEECVAILAEYLSHPSTKFLREVHVGDIWISDWEGPDMTYAADVIAESPLAERLEVVNFMGGDHDISGVSGNYASVAKKCKNLKRLEIYGNDISIGKIDLPKLESFHVYSGGLPGSTVGEISKAKWPKLVDLDIMFGRDEYGGTADVGDLKSILAGKGLAKLKRLGLKNAEFTDQICDALASSKILKQLDHLDLSMGTMTAEGAKVLIENPKLFKHLKTINLDDNYIAKDVHEDLQKLGPDVTLGNQDDDMDYVYASVGE